MPNTDRPNYRTRVEKHAQAAAKLRKEKRRRRYRATIHAAMEKALAMKRSKKKGTADLDANMRSLGWERVKATGHVEDRFRPVNR